MGLVASYRTKRKSLGYSGSAQIILCAMEGNIQCLKRAVHCVRLYKGVVFSFMTPQSNTEYLSSSFIFLTEPLEFLSFQGICVYVKIQLLRS